MDFIHSAQTFISQHAWANTVVIAGGSIATIFILYKLLMSSKAEGLRQKLPFLQFAHSSKEVNQLINRGEFGKAGDKLLEIGETERAIEVFQQGKLYGRVGDIYSEKKNLQKAISFYEKAGDLKKVADICLKTRAYDKLEEMYQRNMRLPDLALFYNQNKKYVRAAELYTKIEDFYKAAENYLLIGDELKTAQMLEKYFHQMWKLESPDTSTTPSKKVSDIAMKAGVLYEKNKKWDEVIKLYNKIGYKKGIANAMTQKGDLSGAAKMAEDVGDFKTASLLQGKIGNETDAARLEAEHLFQEGDLIGAIEKFREAKEFSRCAELYSDLQEFTKAAEMHEFAGEHYLAGKMFLDEKDYAKAGENFEKAGYIDEAILAFRNGKFDDKLVKLFEKNNKYFELADYFVGRKMYDQAAIAAEKIVPTDSNYRFGLFVRGKIKYDRGDYENAQKLFIEALAQTDTLIAQDLNIVHYYALTEQYRNATEFKSLEMIELKLAQNKIEPGAIEKAQNIMRMIRDKSFSRVSQSKILSWRSSGGETSGMPMSSLRPPPIMSPHSERRYSVIKEIGRGGMGVVYLAKDSKLDREVALKILPSSIKNSERIIQTFLREAKSAAALNHPNIVTVFDTGVQDGDYFISMEHIDGKTIKRILKKKGKFAFHVVVELLKQLLSGLEYAHSKKVIHRDLTTNNIMWTRQKLIKIMDFGLAKVIHNLHSEQSIIGGTPSFMSPEQTLGKPADHRTDIYSLGICIFEMTLGTLPFSKGDLGYHHLHTPPPIPKEIDPTIPEVLNEVILRCLQKKPEDRYQTVADIAKALSIV